MLIPSFFSGQLPRASAGNCFRAPLLLLLACVLAGCQFLGRGGKEAEPETVKNPCLVLALPSSGQYAAISTKIRRGAETARAQLHGAGVQVRLENINTESPDWLAKLSALPPMCAVVGGPLRDKAYVEARKAGATSQRAFFAFMPTLQAGDEGKMAWRFFPGPEDQIEALTRFATDELNIRTYGAFSPQDNYGRRMTALLEEGLRKRHIPLQKASYASSTQAAMTEALKPLVRPELAQDGKTLVPHTTFEALFLPDSWKKVDMATTSLLRNGEDRLVLLGTTLWEQGLSGKQIPEAGRYSLAVFPGAWNKNAAPAKLKGAGNDFWTALGYDFVNFGAAVALAARPESSIITSRASKAAPAIRGMAPISWDKNGVAHQHLHLFEITPQGAMPLNVASFRQKRAAIAEKAALRMQGWSNIDPDTGEALPETPAPSSLPPEDEEPRLPEERPVSATHEQEHPAQTAPEIHAQPAQPAQTPLSPVPRPSYKLSLPGK